MTVYKVIYYIYLLYFLLSVFNHQHSIDISTNSSTSLNKLLPHTIEYIFSPPEMTFLSMISSTCFTHTNNSSIKLKPNQVKSQKEIENRNRQRDTICLAMNNKRKCA